MGAGRPWLTIVSFGLVGCATVSGLDDFRTDGSGGGATSSTGQGGSGGESSCAAQCPGYRCDTQAACSHWASCVELRDAGAPSGVYEIDPGTGVIDVYCDSDADDGGWALLLKADGRETTFRYDAEIWTNDTLLAEAANDPSTVEAKLPAFLSLDVQELRVVMITGAETRSLVTRMNEEGPRPLRGWLSMAGKGTNSRAADWISLVPGAELQPNCNRNGLNVLHNNGCCAKVRIGIVTNNEGNCDTPDSALGVGLTQVFYGCAGLPNSATETTVGLAWARCEDELDVTSFAYVYGR